MNLIGGQRLGCLDRPCSPIDGGCGLVEVPVTNSEKVFRILSRTLIYTCRTWRVELEITEPTITLAIRR